MVNSIIFLQGKWVIFLFKCVNETIATTQVGPMMDWSVSKVIMKWKLYVFRNAGTKIVRNDAMLINPWFMMEITQKKNNSIYRVVQIKVYDWVFSLNQLINWFFYCYILFLYLFTDNSFLANMFLKLMEKKWKVKWIREIRVTKRSQSGRDLNGC